MALSSPIVEWFKMWMNNLCKTLSLCSGNQYSVMAVHNTTTHNGRILSRERKDLERLFSTAALDKIFELCTVSNDGEFAALIGR